MATFVYVHQVSNIKFPKEKKMSLTKRQINEIARIVRGDVSTADRDCLDCVNVLADKLAIFCTKYNSDFNSKHFLKACEPRKDGS